MRPVRLAAVSFAALLVICVVLLLMWKSLPLVLESNEGTPEIAAGLNALAAAAGLVVTSVLVGLTWRYVVLTNALVRASIPNVSISWELVWINPREHDLGLRSNIETLLSGSPNDTYSEWHVAVSLTNAGSQEVRVLRAWFGNDDALCEYTGSRLSPKLPLALPAHDTLTLLFPSSTILDLIDLLDATGDAEHMGGNVTAGVALGNGQSLSTPPTPIASFRA